MKTLMGEVNYGRTVYETKAENGETAYVYLLDEALKLATFVKVSFNLAAGDDGAYEAKRVPKILEGFFAKRYVEICMIP